LRRQHILAGSHEIRYVKFRWQPAFLAIANLPAVDPKMEGRVHTLKVNEDPPSRPRFWNGERPAIAAGRIVVMRHIRQIVDRKWITNVGVDRHVVLGDPSLDLIPGKLPVAWDRNLVPTADVIRIRLKPSRGGGGIRRPVKTPCTIQRDTIGRRVPVNHQPGMRGQRRFHICIGQQRSVARLLVPRDDLKIAPIRFATVHEILRLVLSPYLVTNRVSGASVPQVRLDAHHIAPRISGKLTLNRSHRAVRLHLLCPGQQLRPDQEGDHANADAQPKRTEADQQRTRRRARCAEPQQPR